MALTVVIAYDIREDRVQRSVFVCMIEPDDLPAVRGQLAEMIDVEVDSVYVFRQCGTCWDAVGVLGQATVEDTPCYWSVM
ncbi:MAG: CRISPR-associated protein Cas2 [Actinomycetota bacterium]|nr:CRISPR-associated protein Cas2 [Actinomycetota bacterium]